MQHNFEWYKFKYLPTYKGNFKIFISTVIILYFFSPDEEKHGFWFDIQPTTGTTLTAKARVQINVMVRLVDTFGTIMQCTVYKYIYNEC